MMSYKLKRVSFLIGELGNGGQERQLEYIIQLFKFDFNISLIVWSYNESQEVFLKRYQVSNILLLRNESLSNKIKLSREFLVVNKCELLQSYSFYLNFYSFLLTFGKGITVIGGVRNRLLKTREELGFIKFWLNSLFPKRRIANNANYNVGFRSVLLGPVLRNTVVVKNHLDISKFKTKVTNNSTKTFIRTASVSRLFPEKSIDVLLKSLKLLNENTDINFMHYHAGSGPLKEELERMKNEFGLSASVNFIGEVESTNEFLQDKDIFIHSSTYEGFPNVVMEAMATGLPIVSTDCGDVSKLLMNGVNGYIVPIGSHEMIYEKLIALIECPNKIYEFSKKSRSIAEILFDINRLKNETLLAYEELSK